jgi:acetyltransferase-like isoleucine patch superfamily enzyme
MITNNQYIADKFKIKSVKSLLKVIYAKIFWRPFRSRLGSQTTIMRPFTCWSPKSMKIGNRCTIGPNANFKIITSYLSENFNPKISIGSDVYIGQNCEIVCIESIKIGNGVTISDNVYINDSGHNLDPRLGLIMDRPLVKNGIITIEDGCFIGFGVIILGGVTLGKHCVVSAGSVVTSSFPDYTMIMGNPAKVVRRFDMQNGIWI